MVSRPDDDDELEDELEEQGWAEGGGGSLQVGGGNPCPVSYSGAPGNSWLTAAIPVENPCCSCKLTRGGAPDLEEVAEMATGPGARTDSPVGKYMAKVKASEGEKRKAGPNAGAAEPPAEVIRASNAEDSPAGCNPR